MELIIDNYDSFTYNLYQYMGTLNPDIQVIRNDAITVEEIRKLQPDHLILSPGPGRPCDAGVCEPALRELKGKFPILGVCLGHQAIGEVFGGTVTYARQLMHGKQSTVTLDRTSPLFKGLPEQILVGRYHSLAIDPDTLPEVLKATATTEDGEVMAVEHRDYPIYGLQFHPESILTPEGMTIIRNFLDLKITKQQAGGIDHD
ncbi:aminodeoxychorismate/anthranilate synthase component II [uncultured Acidaminococcus sp.]|uniref:anthranilate synthase component II n=1 Tax=uncultured Acidaminococcus sp. TaxID=352152 RepID=UPI00265F84C9|nr:aminodeoxychorismate/anthranilate synthase component II [uncultured Acidaminococcus sp.]